jgi:hypothetical protein
LRVRALDSVHGYGGEEVGIERERKSEEDDEES